MNKVYIVTNQHRWDHKSQQLLPQHDFSTAADFGEAEFLLSPTTRPFGPEAQGIVEELHKRLANYTDKDYLLLVGNPCLIGMTVAIAANYSGGRVNMLQWHGRDGRYIPVEIDLSNKQ